MTGSMKGRTPHALVVGECVRVYARSRPRAGPRKLSSYLRPGLPSIPMAFSGHFAVFCKRDEVTDEHILGGACVSWLVILVTMWLRSQLFVAMVTSEESPVVSVEFTMIERMTPMPSFTPHHESRGRSNSNLG